MVKQVIIVRTDLDMPLGRISAQAAHASIAVFLDMGKWNKDSFTLNNVPEDIQYWMKESFTKVILKVHSEEELNALAEYAELTNLPYAMISDDIKKKMHKMALAIGPATNDKLDVITKGLKLL